MTDADALHEAVNAIEDGDPTSIVTGFEDFFAHFVVEGELSEAGEATLREYGFVIVGGIEIPGMTQVNVAVADEGGEEA